ncbi:hypothetical protein ACFLYB_02310, partial [Chloroflexota bacterium]
TEVEISGAGFVPNEAISVEYDGDEIDIESGDEEADTNGEFTLFIIIPDSEFGEHTVTVKGEDSLTELDNIFTVEPKISANPASGEAGTMVSVTGTGFDSRNGVDFSFGGTPVTNVVWLVEGGGRTNSDGTFAVNLTVPDFASGSYTILVEDEDNNDIFATATFTVVVNTAINLSSTTGLVGDSITVTGSSFGAGATATLYFNDVNIGTVQVGIDGSFTTSLDIPASTTGVHTIKVEDTSGRSATASVSVEPEMTMAPLTGVEGDGVNISGTGFGLNKTITILYGDTAVIPAIPITTGENGSFSGNFYIPAIHGGSYIVTVSDGTSDLLFDFTVETGATISPTSGEMGDAVQVAGQGFGANKNITILYGNSIIAPTTPITTNSTGSFSGSFDVPAIPGGVAAITLNDGTTNISVSFTVKANVEINTTSGKVGDGVGLAGFGFGASKTISVLFNNAPVTLLAPATTASDGTFNNVQFYVPISPGGAVYITISDGIINETINFMVEPSGVGIGQTTTAAKPGYVGMELNVSGDGYKASADVEVIYTSDPVVLKTGKVGVNGSFSVDFTIPASEAGEHSIVVNIDGVEVVEHTFFMESTPPSRPGLSVIYKGIEAEAPISFKWNEVTGDASLPVTYVLQIFTLTGTTEVEVIKKELADTEYTLTDAEILRLVPLENNEYYYWHIQAVDSAGNVSSWSDTDTFTIASPGGGWPGWLTWLLVGLGAFFFFIFAIMLGRRMAYSAY